MPKRIGHFDVLLELGRGGMGIVYKVKDTKTGAMQALKMIPPEALSRPDSALRFKREFRAMQRVEHPNVIRVFEAGTHEGCPFFTMELVEGREIRKFVDGDELIIPSGKDGPPTGLFTEDQRARLNEPNRVKKVADLVIQVAFALAEIHSHRIVHRDLKPDNILVNRAGVAKLMDFGIAKQLSANSEHSSGGMVVGTFKYLSPEQALGGEIDGRADLYCLGIIMYELMTGRHPFYSENSVGYAYHHARKPPPDMEKFNPEVHQRLKAVCEKLIRKEAKDRYPTAEDVIAAIRDAVGDNAPSPPSALESSTRVPAAPAPVRNLPYELAKDQIFQPDLVGRAAELKIASTSFERLLSGKGSVVVVSGPPGIGKSRLVHEVDVALKQRSITFAWGRCSEERSAPYHPFVQILESMIDEVKGRPVDELRRLLGDDAQVLSRHVPALEKLDPAVRPRMAAPLEPQGERLRFLSAVTSFVGRMSALAPRVLVIDDLHLADELSLSLTRHLVETLARPDGEQSVQRGAPIGLALTFDPGHPRAKEVAPLIAKVSTSTGDPAGRAANVPPLALSALSPPDVKAMLTSMIGGSEVAQALADYLHQESGGVPGAVEDRVRAWVESGDFRRKGRQWVFVKKGAGPGDVARPVEVRAATRWDIPVPDFQENTNQKRVARLSNVAKDIAERLAVVGDRFSGSLAERVALRPEDEFLDALDELIKRAILVEEEDDAGYRFADVEDRRALMSGIGDEKKQQLHLLSARAVEDDARRRRRQANPEELSNHYLAAKEPVLAIEQMMTAARLALSASATQTAAQRVREAQELLAAEQATAAAQSSRAADPRLVRADVELVLLRLDVLAAVNEHKECVTLAKRRLPRMQGSVDGKLIAEVLLRLAGSERVLGDLDAALEHTGQVLSRTERGGSHGLRCRAKSLCGQIYEQRGQFELAERYFHDALELARTIGDELEEERARWAIATRRLTSGDLDEAARDFGQLLTQANARGEKLRVTQYVNALAIIAHERAEFDDAEVGYRRMIELAKPAGDRRSLANALNNIAVVRRDQGRYDDGLQLTAKAARILADLDQVENLAYVRIVEAQIFLDRAAANGVKGSTGDNIDALKKADEALDLALKANSAMKVAEAALCRGLGLCRKGDLAGREDIQRGIASGRALNANRLTLFGLLCDVEAAVLAGDRSAAVASYEDGLSRARKTGFVRFERKLHAAASRLGL